MNKTLDTIKDKNMRLLLIGAIIFVTYLAISFALIVATYPTKEHRTIGGQIARLSVTSDGLAAMPATGSKEYEKLNATSEANHIDTSTMITTIAHIIISFILIK
jgi:hypothetical protein